jgi:hypothetical protein
MRGAKASVDGVTRQRSSLTHKKMLLFAHAHNLKSDANIAHITGKPARSRDWFVQEALSQKAGDYVKEEMYPLDEFPAPFDKEKHMEPIGEEYQKCSHAQWKSAHQQADNIDLSQADNIDLSQADNFDLSQADNFDLSQADNFDLSHEAEMEAGTPLSPGVASADSLEFVSSPHSQDDDPILQQKKPSPDSANEWNGGFAKRGWSRSLNGFSKSTVANTYLDRHLTPFQRTRLCECYAEISKCFLLEGK